MTDKKAKNSASRQITADRVGPQTSAKDVKANRPGMRPVLLVLAVLSFLLYANTLNNSYALDRKSVV